MTVCFPPESRYFFPTCPLLCVSVLLCNHPQRKERKNGRDKHAIEVGEGETEGQSPLSCGHLIIPKQNRKLCTRISQEWTLMSVCCTYRVRIDSLDVANRQQRGTRAMAWRGAEARRLKDNPVASLPFFCWIKCKPTHHTQTGTANTKLRTNRNKSSAQEHDGKSCTITLIGPPLLSLSLITKKKKK